MGTSYWHPAGHGSVFQPTPLPLLNGTAEDGCTIIEQPAGLHTLAQRYVDRAVDFIKRQAQAAKPFVLYMPFNHVHNPQFCSDKWCNTSTAIGNGAAIPNPDSVTHGAGIGSSVQEMDDAVGQIMAAIKAAGIDESTLTFFTSDNGAPPNHGPSSNLPLKGFKGSVDEGGIR